MAQHTTEERIAALEDQVRLLLQYKEEQELAKQEQEKKDIALLARFDSFTEDLRRVERVQLRGFEEVRADQIHTTEEIRKEIRTRQTQLRLEFSELFEGHETYVHDRLDLFETHVTGRLDGSEDQLMARLDDHKAAIDDLTVGVQSHKDAIDGLIVVVRDHRAAIDGLTADVRGLAAGQQQILDLLTGQKPKHND